MDFFKHVTKHHAKETFEEHPGVEDIQTEHVQEEEKVIQLKRVP